MRIAIPALLAGLIVSVLIGLYMGYQPVDLHTLQTDPIARAVLFRLRLPRVIMAGIVGASLSLVGASLQALFRNPLAEPFTLGVSGGACTWTNAVGGHSCTTFGIDKESILSSRVSLISLSSASASLSEAAPASAHNFTE